LAHFFNLWDFRPPDFTTWSLLPKIPRCTPVAVRGTTYPGCQNVWLTRVSGKLSPVSTTELKHIPLNVEVGQACYPVNRGRVRREGREGS